MDAELPDERLSYPPAVVEPVQVKLGQRLLTSAVGVSDGHHHAPTRDRFQQALEACLVRRDGRKDAADLVRGDHGPREVATPADARANVDASAREKRRSDAGVPEGHRQIEGSTL